MVQWVKALVTKSNDPSSGLRTYTMKVENQLPEVVLCPPHMHHSALKDNQSIHPSTHP